MLPGSVSDRDVRQFKRNFFVYLVASASSKLGDSLASPKTVLAWVMVAVGAPVAMIAWLVPLRESLSMLPQIALGAVIRRRSRRKPLWLLGCAVQALAILGCAAAAAWMQGAIAGTTILACVVVFSLARSLNSITGKDLLAKAVPKGRRGRLGGWATGISGLLTLVVGIWFTLRGKGDENSTFYVGLLLGATCLWMIAVAAMAAFREQPAERATDRVSWKALVDQLGLLRTDIVFRRFVITRSLLLCSALTAPFYVVLARRHGLGDASLLGSFLVAGGLAASLSAPVWGVLADRSSRRVMIAAAVMATILGIVVFGLVRWYPHLINGRWVFPAFFFALGVAHSGVRAGRKTYVVDLAGGVKRTDYVSVSNSVIGLVLLLVGGLTSVAAFMPPETLVLALSLLGLGGAGFAVALPEIE